MHVRGQSVSTILAITMGAKALTAHLILITRKCSEDVKSRMQIPTHLKCNPKDH
jgi:hypothetical protein